MPIYDLENLAGQWAPQPYGWPRSRERPTAGPLDEETRSILEKQVNLLYQAFLPGAIGNLLISVFFAAALWGRADTATLCFWLAALWTITLARGLLVRRFFRLRPSAGKLRPWINAYAVTAAVAGGIWGLTAFLFITGTDNAAIMLVAFFIAGVSAAGTVFLTPVRRVVEPYLLATLLPLIVHLLVLENSLYGPMGLTVVVFLAVLLMVSRCGHAVIWNTLLAYRENERLKETIATEKQLADEREATLTRLRTLERDNAFFRNIVERTADFPITVHETTGGTIAYANEAACRHFGVDGATLLTLTPRDFDTHVSPPEIAEFETRVRAGESVTFETEHRTGDGELVPVEVAMHPLKVDGKLLCVCYTHDIRERKTAEARRLELEAAIAREETEKHYRGIIEALPDRVVRLDSQGRCVFANAQALRPFDEAVAAADEVDLLGKTALEIGIYTAHPIHRRLYEAAMRAIETGEENSFQEWMSLQGRRTCFELRHIPERDDSGKVVSVIGITRDVTQRAMTEDALRFMAQRGWSPDGEPFLTALARYLGEALEMDYAIIDKLADDPGEAETVAVYAKGDVLPNMRYSLEGTPCENVLNGDLCCYPRQVQQRFPEDAMLAEMGVESYLGVPLWDSRGKAIGMIAVMDGKPITDETTAAGLLRLVATRATAELDREQWEQALEAREDEYRHLVENIPDIIVRYDTECRRTYVKLPRFAKNALKLPLGGTPVEDSNQPAAREHLDRLRKVLASGEPDEWELKSWNRNDAYGNPVRSLIRAAPEFDRDGNVSGVLTIGRDISERVRLQEEVRYQATYDVLTDLPNRRLLSDRLREEIARAGRDRGNVALLFIDLDRFKEVNDTLGHEIGDQLLVEAARRIHRCMRKSDTVARWGGDEFVAVLPGIKNIYQLGNVAQNIIDTVMRPYKIDERMIYISACIGIAGYPRDAHNAETLIACADQAMYMAKEQGRNGFQFFTASMQQQAESHVHLASDLRGADWKEFELHYQPIVETATGRAVKAEALLRWQHPVRGMVRPDRFIPVAEETGVIHALGDWVFREAVKTARQWRELCSGTGLQISVNISPRQFMRGWDIEPWLEYLAEQDLPAACLAVEITESLLLDNQPEVRERLGKLREAGIQVALDDFGTGYSAMAYLKQFPIDYLKIDRSFVNDMLTDENHRAIAETIVIMARRLGLKTIAEGVETSGQRDVLAAAGCDYVQGYLYARPMPADAFLDYAAEGSSPSPAENGPEPDDHPRRTR